MKYIQGVLKKRCLMERIRNEQIRKIQDICYTVATEIFKYKAPPRKGRWKKGKPLPADLRDSGIESHCSFALNKTHIFMGKTSLNLIKYIL